MSENPITYTEGIGPQEETTMPYPTTLIPPEQRLGEIAYNVAYADQWTDRALEARWERVALAVAIEVLSDPASYARALGLELPCRSDDSAPVAGLG